jgi:pyroglutamyl-peptidase
MADLTVLLTGFEPFAASPINPSAEVIAVMQGEQFEGLRLHTLVLPVVSETAATVLCNQLNTLRPDVYIGLGEARGRSAISVERVGVNELDFRIPDNSGVTITEQPIDPQGSLAYPSTYPAEAIREAIWKCNIPAVFSDSAGRYLCNQVLYLGLHWATTHHPATQVGFIHLPSLPAQMAYSDDPKPTMALSLQVEAVRAALGVLNQAVRSNE